MQALSLPLCLVIIFPTVDILVRQRQERFSVVSKIPELVHQHYPWAFSESWWEDKWPEMSSLVSTQNCAIEMPAIVVSAVPN